MVGDRSLTIKSKRSLEEMKVFIWKGGRAQAQIGYNDDLVMPLGVSQYLRNNALRFYQQDVNMTKSIMSSFKTHKNSINQYQVYGNNIPNPYSMKIRDKDVSIKWLL